MTKIGRCILVSQGDIKTYKWVCKTKYAFISAPSCRGGQKLPKFEQTFIVLCPKRIAGTSSILESLNPAVTVMIDIPTKDALYCICTFNAWWEGHVTDYLH